MLRLIYEHGGEMRRRCFTVDAQGELQSAPCGPEPEAPRKAPQRLQDEPEPETPSTPSAALRAILEAAGAVPRDCGTCARWLRRIGVRLDALLAQSVTI